MIAKWQEKIDETPEDYYTDSRLTNAVFKDGRTVDFIEFITKQFSEDLKNSNRTLKDLKLNIKERELQRPSFPFRSDKGRGLTFALNDTWGFKVTLLNYKYDATTKKYWAKLRFDIFDHFGLDVDDVKKNGSMENVRDKTAPWGKILSEATRPRDDQGTALTEYGASDVPFKEAAEGFCAWFILQYMRGYKPFVTMMSKEIIIQGQLK